LVVAEQFMIENLEETQNFLTVDAIDMC
jgi:hypothetical protein